MLAGTNLEFADGVLVLGLGRQQLQYINKQARQQSTTQHTGKQQSHATRIRCAYRRACLGEQVEELHEPLGGDRSETDVQHLQPASNRSAP